MGGGDLNLKKSWHPQTLRNVEKVWKAEQKAEAESKKIEQLQRELNEEREREEMQRYAVDQGIAKKKSDRLEWMYSAPGHSGVNREEYLLGKSIDKAVDPLAVNEQQSADAPGASFMEDAPSASADMATKIRDDPLFMIKKKENAKKKELLKNPVRMKQLQEMLKADLGSKTGKKMKKEKKKRRKEKQRKYSLSDENVSKQEKVHRDGKRINGESSDVSERQHSRLENHSKRALEKHRDKFSRSHNGKEDRKRRSSLSPRRDDTNRKNGRQNSENYRDSSPKRKQKYNKNDSVEQHNSRNVSSRAKARSSSRSSSPSPKRERKTNHVKNNSSERKRDNGALRKETRSSSRSRSPKRMPRDKHNPENYSQLNSRVRAKDTHENQRSPRRRLRSRSRSPIASQRNSKRENRYTDPSRKPKDTGGTRNMTKEERERKIAEMMDNAKWRDEQRGKNVKRYKKEEEDEERALAKHNEKGASFVRPMKVDTFTSSTASVENRIKRNIHSLQRTPAALENFLRK